MAKDLIKSASFQSKTNVNLPEGAEIIKKDISVRVEEIENGFIVSKSYDIKYSVEGESNYEYFTKQWYTEENPLDVDDNIEEELSLADKFDS